MKINRLLACLCVVGLSAVFGSGVSAQTGTSQPPKHHLGLHMPHMGGHMPAIHGRIIGNKQTHVYHLPGDKGSLPAEKNRVYFNTEAQAQAAGYRRAGTGAHGGGHMSHGAAGHHKMGHMSMPSGAH